MRTLHFRVAPQKLRLQIPKELLHLPMVGVVRASTAGRAHLAGACCRRLGRAEIDDMGASQHAGTQTRRRGHLAREHALGGALEGRRRRERGRHAQRVPRSAAAGRQGVNLLGPRTDLRAAPSSACLDLSAGRLRRGRASRPGRAEAPGVQGPRARPRRGVHSPWDLQHGGGQALRRLGSCMGAGPPQYHEQVHASCTAVQAGPTGGTARACHRPSKSRMKLDCSCRKTRRPAPGSSSTVNVVSKLPENTRNSHLHFCAPAPRVSGVPRAVQAAQRSRRADQRRTCSTWRCPFTTRLPDSSTVLYVRARPS